MTNKLSLLAIFAHPDDEAFGTGGTLTKYAHEGVDVHLIVATRGEVGSIVNPTITPIHPKSVLRERELRCASKHFGLKSLYMLGYMDGQTAIVPPSEAVYKIVKLIREIKPQVVLTFGPEGGYGHFDHLVVHRWAMAAVELAAETDKWSEVGPAHPVDKVYHRAMPHQQIEKMKEFSGRATVFMDGIPFPFTGYLMSEITTIINSQDYIETKLAGIRCYASQINPDTMPFSQEDFDAVANSWFWQETFVLAQARDDLVIPPDTAKEDDFFRGLR